MSESETRRLSNEQRHILPCHFKIYWATLSLEGGGSLKAKYEADLSMLGRWCYKGGPRAAQCMLVKHFMLFFFNRRSSHLLTSAFAGRDYNQEANGVSWRLEWV